MLESTTEQADSEDGFYQHIGIPEIRDAYGLRYLEYWFSDSTCREGLELSLDRPRITVRVTSGDFNTDPNGESVKAFRRNWNFVDEKAQVAYKVRLNEKAQKFLKKVLLGKSED